MTDPLDPGQQSLITLTAGHPLALKRLKELMRDAERIDLLHSWAIADDQPKAEKLAQHLHIDKMSLRQAIDAIAEGG